MGLYVLINNSLNWVIERMNECECPNIKKRVEQTTDKTVEKMIGVKNFLCKEFVYGGHLASLCVSFIALSMILLFDIAIKWELILIVYFSTICVYNYDHYKEFKKDDKS